MSTQEVAAVISGSAAFAVAVIGLVATHQASKRDRRRQTYAEAIKVALAWHEMLYRVRRRTPGDEAALVARFHEVQENITFHNAWIGSESRNMARSYGRLIRVVKSKTEGHIAQAWSRPPISPGNAPADDEHPEVQSDADKFLRDVRSHLSLQPWRRIALYWRNRNCK